ncbi:MAG: YraN family protein [Gammaproteobacteria bacterium]|nr:YraN family protein [Gammaproteobacteria bacterium]
MKQTSSKGQQKERQAKTWLTQQGVQIIQENFHCRGGEIDLIGLSSSAKETTVIFFEVKFRKNSSFGHPAEFVTPQKQRRIIQCAQTFLLKYPAYQNAPLRFDVITFEGNQIVPEWIQNAFGAN